MKWLKHDTNARYDSKLMRLIKKHGLRGYGLYWGIVEWIGSQLELSKPVPDLEETSLEISSFFCEKFETIEKIIKECIDIGLLQFNKKTNRIECIQLLSHLDNTMSASPYIKKIINSFRRLSNSPEKYKNLSITSRNFKKLQDASRKNKSLQETSLRGDKIRGDKIRLDYTLLGEYVHLQFSEYKQLRKKYTRQAVRWMLEKLAAYKVSTGNNYNNDFAAIMKWGVDNFEEAKKKGIIDFEGNAKRGNSQQKKEKLSLEDMV